MNFIYEIIYYYTVELHRYLAGGLNRLTMHFIEVFFSKASKKNREVTVEYISRGC